MSSLEYMAGFSENTCGIDTITEDVYEENGSTIASGLDSIPFDHKQGKEVFLCPTSEDEVANVQCLLAEPQNEKLLEVDARALKMEDEVAFGDFAYSLDCYDYVYEAYNGKMHSEILYSDLLQNGGHETHIDFADSVFQGIEDETLDKNLCMPEHLAHAGSIFTGKSSCYESNIDCHLQSFDFECPPQSVRKEHQGSDNPVKQISMVPKAEFSVDADGKSVPFLDDMGICELHQVFRSTFGRDTFINDKEWLKRRILFGFGDDNEFSSDPFQLKGGLCSVEDDGGFAFSNDLSFPERLGDLTEDNCDQNVVLSEEVVTRDGDTGTDTKTSTCFEVSGLWHLDLTDKNDEYNSRKRLRKPTRRYIEESSLEKSKKYHQTLQSPISAARRKNSTIEIQKELCDGSPEALPFMCKRKSSVDSVSQMVCANRARRGRPRKNMNHMENDFYKMRNYKSHISVPKCTSSVVSQFDPKDDISDFSDLDDRKIGIRRKHHRLWSLSEVMKLIEGVSRYGVGRWTEIKKYLFYSSTHRTSVDLKDKWRNLLRASGAQIHGKEVQKRKKQISHSIPPAVVLRVRELAVVYPYPRQRETRCDESAACALTSIVEN